MIDRIIESCVFINWNNARSYLEIKYYQNELIILSLKNRIEKKQNLFDISHCPNFPTINGTCKQNAWKLYVDAHSPDAQILVEHHSVTRGANKRSRAVPLSKLFKGLQLTACLDGRVTPPSPYYTHITTDDQRWTIHLHAYNKISNNSHAKLYIWAFPPSSFRYLQNVIVKIIEY